MIVLIDTGAFYALADDSDRNAPAARAFFREQLLVGRFATTEAVLFETWTLIRNRLGWGAAQRFLEGFRAAGFALLCVEPSDLEAAWRIMSEYADQELSLVDAATFAVMDRHGIQQAFTFDKDFLLYRYGAKRQRSFVCRP